MLFAYFFNTQYFKRKNFNDQVKQNLVIFKIPIKKIFLCVNHD